MTVLADPGQALADLALRHLASTAREPAWLTARRRQGAEWLASHGFPTRRDEDWRYLPLREVLDPAFGLPDGHDDGDDRARRVLRAASPGVGAARLVFVNGHLSLPLSRRGPLPAGARLRALSEAAGESVGPTAWGASPMAPTRHGFAALNLSLCADGALLELPPGTIVDEPIELVFVNLPGGHRMVTSPRSLLHLGEGSRATVVETHAGEPGGGYLTTAVTEVRLDAGARLEHHRLQLESADALHLSSLEVTQAAGSRLCSHLVALGARVGRHEVTVHLEGNGADASLEGLYLPLGGQYHDQPILVEHAAPGGVSRQRFVGVVDRGGHGVFNGHVIVRAGAVGTDARQSNANLLLSDHAEVDTRPRLEIFADDVACSHGAAVGRLDPDALFYLRSRGLPEPLARAVLVEAFTRQITGHIELDTLRARVERLVTDRLDAHPDGGGKRQSRASGPTGRGGEE